MRVVEAHDRDAVSVTLRVAARRRARARGTTPRTRRRGRAASLSREPPRRRGRERIHVARGERDDARARDSARRRCAGTTVFIAQVIAGAPVVPNFWPAMKTTFGASGKRATASRSSRSRSIVSTPASFERALGAVGRPARHGDDAAAGRATARAAMRASVGPILPPAPRMTMSPGQAASAATVSLRGVDRRSSSSASFMSVFGCLGFYAIIALRACSLMRETIAFSPTSRPERPMPSISCCTKSSGMARVVSGADR